MYSKFKTLIITTGARLIHKGAVIYVVGPAWGWYVPLPPNQAGVCVKGC